MHIPWRERYDYMEDGGCSSSSRNKREPYECTLLPYILKNSSSEHTFRPPPRWAPTNLGGIDAYELIIICCQDEAPSGCIMQQAWWQRPQDDIGMLVF